MRDYELVVLLPVGNEETILSQVEKTIEQNKGKVVKTEKWGTKELSYPIAKLEQASFFLLNISVAPEGAVLLERTLRVNESVIRYLFVRKEKKDAGHKGSSKGFAKSSIVEGATREKPEVKAKPVKEKKMVKSAKKAGGEKR